MKSITTRFGIGGGVLIIVYTMLVFVIFGDFSTMSAEDLPTQEALGYLRYAILILAVLFAIRSFRRQSEFPQTYWRLVKQGVFVALVIAALVGLMELVYIWLNPEFFDTYARLYLENLENKGASAEQIEEAKGMMKQFDWMRNPFLSGIFYFFETAVIGSVAALLLSFFFRSK